MIRLFRLKKRRWSECGESAICCHCEANRRFAQSNDKSFLDSQKDNRAFYAKCNKYTATKTSAIPKNPMGFSRCLKKTYPPPTVPKMPIAPHSVYATGNSIPKSSASASSKNTLSTRISARIPHHSCLKPYDFANAKFAIMSSMPERNTRKNAIIAPLLCCGLLRCVRFACALRNDERS